MSSVLMEIVTWLLGDAISSQIPSAPTPEGAFNASLGAIAAFFGFVAVLVAIAALILPWNAHHVSWDAVLLEATLFTVVAGCAALAILAGRRAPRVTSRNLPLAKAACGASMLAIAASGLALAITTAQALL
jgi:hypothetical protein